jgi:hypothetical protein
MELFVDWGKEDYLEYLAFVLIFMAAVFTASSCYKRQKIMKLKGLEIPLKVR